MARVICPFCLQFHDFTSSLVCSSPADGEAPERVPPVYVRDYDEVPPLWMTMVGFRRHGKTTYLAALNVLLERIHELVPGVYCRPLDGPTLERVRRMREEVARGRSAESTPHQNIRPLLFHVRNIPEFGSRCLVQYDVAGETYDSFGEIGRYAPALKRVNTAWFLISLRDLETDGKGRTIHDLFNTYLSSMEELRIDVRGWNLIVIYTKADLLDLRDQPQLRSFLVSDPFAFEDRAGGASDADGVSLPQYMQDLRGFSLRLEDYTRRRVRGGSAFIAMVADQGMSLVFTMTSATSQSPDSGTGELREDPVARRVLDPLLWAMELSKPVAPPVWRLVLGEGRAQDDGSLARAVWQALADRGEVMVHRLGRRAVWSGPGQAFLTLPPGGAPSLVGPALDAAAPDERVVVLGADRALDLGDFIGTGWDRRLQLVRFEEAPITGWPGAILHRASDSPGSLLERLLQG